jgi:hypothetical protein
MCPNTPARFTPPPRSAHGRSTPRSTPIQKTPAPAQPSHPRGRGTHTDSTAPGGVHRTMVWKVSGWRRATAGSASGQPSAPDGRGAPRPGYTAVSTSSRDTWHAAVPWDSPSKTCARERSSVCARERVRGERGWVGGCVGAHPLPHTHASKQAKAGKSRHTETQVQKLPRVQKHAESSTQGAAPTPHQTTPQRPQPWVLHAPKSAAQPPHTSWTGP